MEKIVRHKFLRSLIFFVILFFLPLLISSQLLTSCKPTYRERPYGYLKLGEVVDLSQEETFLESERVLVRYDKDGFSVMSALCSYDLSPLRLVEHGGQRIWRSSYSQSSYSYDGKVLTGPATRNLPYYQLVLDSGTYNGPKDTLYARIGNKVEPTWRLGINN